MFTRFIAAVKAAPVKAVMLGLILAAALAGVFTGSVPFSYIIDYVTTVITATETTGELPTYELPSDPVPTSTDAGIK